MKKISRQMVLKGTVALFALIFLFELIRPGASRFRQGVMSPSRSIPAAQVEPPAPFPRAGNDLFMSNEVPLAKKTKEMIWLGSSRGAATGSAGYPAGAPEALETSESQLPYDPFRKIIKSADLSIQVKDVGNAYNQILADLGSVSGYVLKSDFSQSDPSIPQSASLVLEVPSAQFDSAFAELSKIGKVTSRSIGGQDVTEDYVDLQSRLRHLTDVATQLTEILTRAKTIGDILNVQNQLNQVQEEIEQTKGRLQLISHQSAMSQISVELTQIMPVTKPAATTFASALWKQFQDGMKGGVESVVSAFVQTLSVFAVLLIWIFGYFFPIFLGGLLLWKIFLRYGSGREIPRAS